MKDDGAVKRRAALGQRLDAMFALRDALGCGARQQTISVTRDRDYDEGHERAWCAVVGGDWRAYGSDPDAAIDALLARHVGAAAKERTALTTKADTFARALASAEALDG